MKYILKCVSGAIVSLGSCFLRSLSIPWLCVLTYLSCRQSLSIRPASPFFSLSDVAQRAFVRAADRRAVGQHQLPDLLRTRAHAFRQEPRSATVIALGTPRARPGSGLSFAQENRTQIKSAVHTPPCFRQQ